MTSQSLNEDNRPNDTVGSLVHLGAGQCSELDSYLALRPRQILLIEADPQLAEGLKTRTEHMPQIEVRCAAVAMNSGPVTFRRFNLCDAGSLHPPTGMLKLYPGLRVMKLLQMEAIKPDSLMEPLELKPHQNNCLVIDLPGEELKVLQVLESAGQLQLFGRLKLYCGREPLYEGGEPAGRILEWLQERGFDLLGEEIIKDPDLPRWSLSRNTLKLQNQNLMSQMEQVMVQLEELKLKNETYQVRSEEYESNLQALKQERDENAKAVEDFKEQLDQANKEKEKETELVSKLQQERDENAKAVEDLKEQLDQANKEKEKETDLVSKLRQELENITREREDLSKLADERQLVLNKITSGNTQHIEQITQLLKNQQDHLDKIGQEFKSDLMRETSNSTKQLESFIGIQTYLTRGQIIPEMHGWPISPDLAFYLINLIEENKYDLILEFGSGTSTIIMAKAVLKQIQRQAIHQFQLSEYSGREVLRIPYREELDNLIQMTPTILQQALSDFRGIPPRIISFEHHRQFFEETSAKLKQTHVAEMVELIHAPLRDYVTREDEHFLYYACEEKIADLAGELNAGRSSILVIVDGPPAVTGKHARYPALPILLQYLSDHKLDILLDDYIRQDEKEIVDMWTKVLDSRSIVYEKKILKMEKNACRISFE